MICDINMSPGDGFNFLSEVRSGKYGLAHIPFVFLTCNSETDNVKKAAELGVAGYLLKPVTMADLRDRYLKHIERFMVTTFISRRVRGP